MCGWTRGKWKRYPDRPRRRGKKKGGTLLNRSIGLLPLFSPYTSPIVSGREAAEWASALPLILFARHAPACRFHSPRPLEAAFCPIMRAKYCRHGTTSTVVATKRGKKSKEISLARLMHPDSVGSMANTLRYALFSKSWRGEIGYSSSLRYTQENWPFL